ncbi:hypothetical protein JCM9957A_15380 [Kineosporia succinea]
MLAFSCVLEDDVVAAVPALTFASGDAVVVAAAVEVAEGVVPAGVGVVDAVLAPRSPRFGQAWTAVADTPTTSTAVAPAIVAIRRRPCFAFPAVCFTAVTLTAEKGQLAGQFPNDRPITPGDLILVGAVWPGRSWCARHRLRRGCPPRLDVRLALVGFRNIEV